MKVCKTCKNLKEESEFYKSKTCKDKLSVICKSCHLEKYYIPTPNKKICKECKVSLNADNGRNSGHKRKDGSMIYANKCKNCHKKHYKKYIKQRYSTDIEYKIKRVLRSRINEAVRNYNFNKKDSSIEELGCSIKEYVSYLEYQFTDEMNWDNHGMYWEIDHIHPISKGGSFHYTNTQPLTVIENRKKGNKI